MRVPLDDGRHPHLRLAREEPVTERRQPSGAYPRTKLPDDPQEHAAGLVQRLREEMQTPPADIGGYDPRRLIKVRLNQPISPEDVARACGGIEIVSQENNDLVLAFATETQLETFEERLAGFLIDGSVTYKRLLYALQDFDRWTPEDRTGPALKRHGIPDSSEFTIDAELWPLGRHSHADRQRQAFVDWTTRHGGKVLDSVRQPYLTVYRIRCSRPTVSLLLQHRAVRTVDLPPRVVLPQAVATQEIQELAHVPAPPANAPGIVVLDTGLATGHPLLAPAVGDSQSFLDGASSADEHGHGTFVSGIALYDDIAELQQGPGFVPKLRLFSGRILNDRNEGDPRLIENQVERAVRYFRDAYGCRVFSLCYGNPYRPYNGRHVAGLAVTLDALSRELDVLFVIPTGNLSGVEASPENWREEYPDYLSGDEARLLDPGPALNALTVGSLARHDLHRRWPDDPGYRPVARAGQPSPFTRRGPSVNKALKPDMVDYGGNYVVMSGAGDHLLRSAPGLGELSVSPDFAEGRPFAEDNGTSFAAPRVANAAANLFREFPDGSVDLCRALLVAHAKQPQACADLFDGDGASLRNVTGYGRVDRSALYRSADSCVTLWATESIPNRRHHFFEIPLPEAFWEGQQRARELTVALAYRPPVRTTRVDYRASRISFKVVKGESLGQIAAWFDAAENPDALDRISEYARGRGLSESIRSRGTVQASTWRFERPSRQVRESRWFVVVTRNDPPWGEPLCSESEPYALAVMLDDRATHQLRIAPSLYAQVRARLRERVRARAQR